MKLNAYSLHEDVQDEADEHEHEYEYEYEYDDDVVLPV